MYPQSTSGQNVVSRGSANSFDLMHNVLSAGNISYRVRDTPNAVYRQISRNISFFRDNFNQNDPSQLPFMSTLR